MELKALRRSWRGSVRASPKMLRMSTQFGSTSPAASPAAVDRCFTPPPPLRFKPLQVRSLSTVTRSQIDRAVASAPVVLFMKGTPETPQCGFSRASVQILGLQGVDPLKFHSFNVFEDDEFRQGIKEYSEWPTIPQLYVNKELVGGCDILMAMHQDGRLAELLENEQVLAAEPATAA